MGSWMPEINPDMVKAAIGRRQPPNYAEQSRAAMLEPINRWKTPLGRATTPEEYEAVRRSEVAKSSSVGSG